MTLPSPPRLGIFCLLLTAHCQLVFAAPVAIRWTSETSRPAPVDIPVFQGETIYIEPAFATYGTALTLSNCTAALYWQTNGMDSAWWSVPASIVPGDPVRVRAIWSPTNDVGAMRYTYFLGVTSSAGAAYRAYGTLMMRAAPGATPSVLAAPTTLTDAMAAWADSRYDPAGSAQTVSNALASGAALGTTALQPSWAATGHVATAGYADAATSAYSADWAAEATYATDAGRADDLLPDGTAVQRIAADIAAATNDIRAAIDAIPLPPTNTVAGWLVWDSGSNCYWQVTATNLRFYVWGVAE